MLSKKKINNRKWEKEINWNGDYIPTYIFYQYIDYSMHYWVFYSLSSPPLLS